MQYVLQKAFLEEQVSNDKIIIQGKRVIVLTNNATKSRSAYGRKLLNLGFPSCIGTEDIVNPAAVVAEELSL